MPVSIPFPIPISISDRTKTRKFPNPTPTTYQNYHHSRQQGQSSDPPLARNNLPTVSVSEIVPCALLAGICTTLGNLESFTAYIIVLWNILLHVIIQSIELYLPREKALPRRHHGQHNE